MSETGAEPFYFPDPGLFAHPDAYKTYTDYAADLEQLGLRHLFPTDPALRNVVIEILAEGYSLDYVEMFPGIVEEVLPEAEEALRRRSDPRSG